MITVTGLEQLKAWRAGCLPEVEQVRPNVWSVPVPFPGSPIRYTLAYLLVGEGGAIVVDPGWSSETGWHHLTGGLQKAGLGVGDVTGIVVTHFHPDHLGLAASLAKESGAWLAMGEDETFPATSAESITAEAHQTHAKLLTWGVPTPRLPELRFRPDASDIFGGFSSVDMMLKHGQALPLAGVALEVVATPGHSKGHICVLDHTHELIFSGDHVLPKITPNIPFEAHGLADPLTTYLSSLAVIGSHHGYEVLPAHEFRFKGIAERAAEMVSRHEERSMQILSTLRSTPGKTVWGVASELRWSRGWGSLQGMNLHFALAETASHLVSLRANGYEVDIPGLESAPQHAPIF